MQHGTETLLAYDVLITFTNKPTNLVFYSDSDKTNAMIVEDGRYLSLNGFMSLQDNKKRDIPIYWQWELDTGSTPEEIEANDLIDTSFIGKTMSMQIDTTGRQVTENPLSTQYAVTFDANGGTIDGYGNSSQATKMVTYGEAYGDLPTPTRTGYRFVGWNGKNLFDKNSIVENENRYICGDNVYEGYSEFSVYLIEIKPNCSYVLKNKGRKVRPGYVILDENMNYITGENYDGREIIKFTSPSNAKYIKLSAVVINDESEGYRYDLDVMQFEEGNEATQYEPYIINSSTPVTQNKNHTLTAIWEPAN